MIVAVRVKDDGPPPELLLQTIGIQLCLLLAYARVALRALGLVQRERDAVIAPENIIHEALARFAGHSRDRKLPVTLLIERPASFLEQQVNEVVARLGFRVIVFVR